MAWWDIIQSGVLALVLPVLIMIGVRLQKQDETIRRVISLEEDNWRTDRQVNTNSRDIAVLKSQYELILNTLIRIENKVDKA